MKRERVLITGAGGFIGRCLAQRLAAGGVEVIGSGRSPAEGPWQHFVQWDIEQPAPEHPALLGIDRIYHLASKAHALSERPGETSGYAGVIVHGTRNVLDFARSADVPALVYLSSVKAMGEGQGMRGPLPVLTEAAGLHPTSPYGIAKAEAEALVLAAGLQFCAILRPAMVFGAGQKGNLLRMMEAVKRGRFPPVPDNGNRRSMVHVDDLLDACLRVAEVPAANRCSFIITGPESPSTRQLYDWMREALGLPPSELAIPLWLLKATAAMGTLFGTLLRRRLPLDNDTLEKLLGSAHYSSESAQRVFGYTPGRAISRFILAADGAG